MMAGGTARRGWLVGALVLGLGAMGAEVARAQSRPLDISGTYTVFGRDAEGMYRGQARLTQGPGGQVTGSLSYDYVRWTWRSFSYEPTGKQGAAGLSGSLRGLTLDLERRPNLGLTGALDGASAQAVQARYTVQRTRLDDGSWGVRRISGRYGSARESFYDHRPGSADDDAGSGDGAIQLPAKLVAVPGAPAEGRQPVTVTVQGARATLELSGPARLVQGGQVVLAAGSSLELAAGSHSYEVEGTGDGQAVLVLKRGATEVARASSEVAVERLYAILFGYMGAEVDYLDSDIKKVIDNLMPHLAGYARVEDGSSYDQSKIDQALRDPNNPRRVLIDWCVTQDDLFRYLRRGTLRGLFWSSHGFMEPFPNCPDSELDHFESRVWSSASGAPESTDAKSWVRMWREAIASAVQTHGKLDFAIMHSCCTGEIGSYADEVWHYTAADTKSRAERILGVPLPPANRLRYTSFNALRAEVTYVQTYVGPAYFGLWDVSWRSMQRSLVPTR